MDIAVSRELGIPLSTQVHDQIVAAISKGDLRPGDRLPTIRQLADFLELNRNTIAQVYRTLEQEGYVITRGGGGTTVADTPATRAAVRIQELHRIAREALQLAEHKGFSAREFGDVAWYEATHRQAMRNIAFLVVDEYRGELDYLCRAISRLQPDAVVHGALISELAAGITGDEQRSLPEADFALVPFYCLAQARGVLATLGIPVLAAGIGPSVAALRQISEQTAGRQVTIVCTDPSGPRFMERALRHAGVTFDHAWHAYVGQPEFEAMVAAGEVVVASEGSAAAVAELAPDKTVLDFSGLLSEESLIVIHRYAETVKSDRAARERLWRRTSDASGGAEAAT